MDIFRHILVMFLRIGELQWVQYVLGLLAGLKIRGHFTSPHREPNLPEGVLTIDARLNDSVWELRSPVGEPDVEIIFFHGLQTFDFEDAFWKTWLARDFKETVIWPREWLTKKLPNARILSITYNTSVLKADGQLDMHNLGENLVEDIIRVSKGGDSPKCPVFLVGHSLGGIIIKQFMKSAVEMKGRSQSPQEIARIQGFLDSFKGVFYYATPHGGSNIANFVRDAGLPIKSNLIRFLSTLDKEKQRINDEFRMLLKKFDVPSFAVAEGLPLIKAVCGLVLFQAEIVPEASALVDYSSGKYMDTKADHITVCKASKNDTAVIENLFQFITETVPDIQKTKIANSDLYVWP